MNNYQIYSNAGEILLEIEAEKLAVLNGIIVLLNGVELVATIPLGTFVVKKRA